MFFFVNLEGDPRATSQDKGKLFESLIGEIVASHGYRIVEMRAKTGGKEYDVIAKAKLDQRPLIGQAKAWDKLIAAKEISEFSGSLDLEDFPEDALGLFVSLTDFTPEAKAYLAKLNKNKRSRIITIVGNQIFDCLKEASYPSVEEIKRHAGQAFQQKPSDTYLLVSNRGNFFIQLLVRLDETRPKAFCVFDDRGTLISEGEFGKQLKQRIEELKELTFLAQHGNFISVLDLPPGLVGPEPEGAGWFEYKLPAPPQYFIGRDNQIDSFQSFLKDVQEGHTNIHVYQVLSPSGVGKTSFLLKIQSLLKQPTCTAFEDARNLRSSVDLLALMQDFLDSSRSILGVPTVVPLDTISVLEQFKGVDRELQKRGLVGVIFVDQFESLFLKPELYTHFLDLVIRVIYDAKRIVFCIARRNDQPTTYDERVELDLQRLISMSNSVELKDFSRTEAVELLSHLSVEIGQSIKPRLENLALEFAASGYPWLCKRVGAHIWSALLKKGLSQEDLIQDGIRPEELFDEDLAGLVLMDRELLKDFAKYLPATLDELSQKFDGKLLAMKLKLFHDMRLVRLIGRTYDTYNDVFKEYLKTGKVPLPTKYIFRSSAPTTRKVLDTIIIRNCQNLKALSEQLSGLSYGTVQNVLRELRMLELVETSRGILSVDQETKDAYQKGQLDTLFKDKLRHRNGLVRDVLNRIALQDQITLKQLAEYLKEGLPVLEVSDISWNAYARTFAGWLISFGLVRPGQILGERSKAVGGTRSVNNRSGMFLPSIYITELVHTVEKFRHSNLIPKSSIGYQETFDCEKVGLLQPDVTGDYLELTRSGQAFKDNDLVREKIVRDFLLSLPYVADYLRFTENSRKRHTDVLKSVMVGMVFTEETWLWRSKVIANWLEFANLITRKGGYIQKSQQASLFE